MNNINIDIISKTLVGDKIKDSIDRYLYIMQIYSICDVTRDREFQRLYDGFYRVRRNLKFRERYFEFMKLNRKNDITFEKTITYFYNMFNSIEASFSSKLLATIDPNKPVWDKYVLHNLGLIKPSYQKAGRLQDTINIYYRLVKWYSEYLETPNAKEVINIFDEIYPDKELTNVKKIDFALWSIREKN